MRLRIKKFIKNRINRFIDFFSFNGEVRRLVSMLNRKIDQSAEISLLNSYPGGFKREIGKRRIRMAIAYINLVQQLESEKYEERLLALERIVYESLHAKNVDMPLNTARVQAALMKDAVTFRGNLRKQSECLMDFTRASYGQPSVIREFLKRIMIIEVPEKSKKLCEMELGWDDHVHDNLSEGRKTPSQVLLDAFIKGLSEVTLAYYDFTDEKILNEALKSGEILGIRVRIGIEFSVGKAMEREYFMYLIPHFTRIEEVVDFFSREDLSVFMAGLEKNSFSREQTIKDMLNYFNEIYLHNFNSDVSGVDCFKLEPLRWEDLKKIVLEGQASRMHLGDLLYRSFKVVLHKRLLLFKAQYESLLEEVRRKRKSRTELNAVSLIYSKLRKTYEDLSPETLRHKYFEYRQAFDYDSAFLKREEIFSSLVKAGGEIIYIHPLTGGVQNSINTIISCYKYLSQVEIFNMQDSIYRNPTQYQTLNHFIFLINNSSFEDTKAFLQRIHITADDKGLREAWDYYHENHLLTCCGSDSTGRDPKIPGMGFIRLSSIPDSSLRSFFLKTHMELPLDVDKSLGVKRSVDDDYSFSAKIISLSSVAKFRKNSVGDEKDLVQIDPENFWRYLNPAIKNLIKVGVALIPACFSIGLNYTLVWFSITFIRNVIADMTSASGFNPKDWHFRDIDFENAANSIFCSGISIPLLKSADELFKNYAHILIKSDFILRWGDFLFLSTVRGTYLYIHNTIRGFRKDVKNMNFFRSILSFQFASTFSYLLDLLDIGFIPRIVQTKFWSDVVAGFIEGRGKYKLIERLRTRDFSELIPLLDASEDKKRIAAMVDIMYIWAMSQRGKASLYKILLSDRELLNKFYFLYTSQHAMEEMLEVILTYYHNIEAVVLSDIIGKLYPSLCTWLIKLHKKLN
ncbi:MAG TPA: hypothetical protein PL110_08015 [Candidatus Eremiobacteraeota bacterium]|nr:hypothetical protein [Candidatus Eremiobacteraeota bacterium]